MLWLKLAPMHIFGHKCFGHNSAIFGPIGLNIFMLVYYLSIGVKMLICYFWATFGGKIGVATTRAPYGLGPPNPTRKLAQ